MSSEHSSYATLLEIVADNAIRNGIGEATVSDLNYCPLNERPNLGVLAEKQELLGNVFAVLQVQFHKSSSALTACATRLLHPAQFGWSQTRENRERAR